jgi:hypothetical protein
MVAFEIGDQGADKFPVIAGFFTGGALAIRGGAKAARNSAIGCACLLAVIEGVGIGFQRMMAENTRLDVRSKLPPFQNLLTYSSVTTTTSTSRRWKDRIPSCRINLSNLIPSCHTSQMTPHTTLLIPSLAKRRLGLCILLGLGLAHLSCVCIAGTV